MKGIYFKKLRLFFCQALIISVNVLYSQGKVLDLWDNGIPGSIASEDYREEFRKNSKGSITGISKVSVPTLSVFLPEKDKPNGTAVVILPGGGYGHLSIDKEGYKVAKWFNELGVTAFVLKYRLPSDEIMEDKSLAPLADAQKAIRIVRQSAEEWQLDSNKIGVLGFSAGGHLAASLSNRFDEEITSEKGDGSARPDFSVLVYPVISMTQELTHQGSRQKLLGNTPSDDVVKSFSFETTVAENAPPTFLIHATDDRAVPVENTLNYYQALKDRNVPVELHIYENGGHGFGLGVEGTSKEWPQSLKQWLVQNIFLQE